MTETIKSGRFGQVSATLCENNLCNLVLMDFLYSGNFNLTSDRSRNSELANKRL